MKFHGRIDNSSRFPSECSSLWVSLEVWQGSHCLRFSSILFVLLLAFSRMSNLQCNFNQETMSSRKYVPITYICGTVFRTLDVPRLRLRTETMKDEKKGKLYNSTVFAVGIYEKYISRHTPTHYISHLTFFSNTTCLASESPILNTYKHSTYTNTKHI